MKIEELRNIIKEAVEDELAKAPNLEDGIPKDVTSAEKKLNKDFPEEMIKDGDEYDKQPDSKLEPGDAKDTDYKFQADDANRGKGIERLKYDNINQKFQDRVKALVMGKNSESQADIDDKASGVDTSGNEKFYNRAAELNKNDNEHSGVNGTAIAATQMGDDIEILPGEKPAHQDNAFEKVEGDTKEQSVMVNDAEGKKTLSADIKDTDNTNDSTKDVSEPKKDDRKDESKMKRLSFNKTSFITENHMLSLIPEQYKVDGSRFIMKDMKGNEYTISVNEGKCEVESHENKQAFDAQLARIKQLFEYRCEDAFGGISEKVTHQQAVDNVRKVIKESKVI